MSKNIILQQPDWPDKAHYKKIIKDLSTYPNLVFPEEIIELKNEFKKVAKGEKFVIQGGDPNSKDDDRMNDATGGRAGKFFGVGRENDPSTWTIPEEFNDSLHIKGTLSMARSQNPNSGSSQFFICHAPTPQLNGKYTVFGQVIKGLDVIDKIVNVDRPNKDNPSYGGPDGDNPFEKVTMNVKIMKQSQAIAD